MGNTRGGSQKVGARKAARGIVALRVSASLGSSCVSSRGLHCRGEGVRHQIGQCRSWPQSRVRPERGLGEGGVREGRGGLNSTLASSSLGDSTSVNFYFGQNLCFGCLVASGVVGPVRVWPYSNRGELLEFQVPMLPLQGLVRRMTIPSICTNMAAFSAFLSVSSPTHRGRRLATAALSSHVQVASSNELHSPSGKELEAKHQLFSCNVSSSRGLWSNISWEHQEQFPSPLLS